MQVSPARLGGDFFLADCINAVNATLVTAPIIAARLGPSAASPLLLNGLGHASIHETTCLLLVIRAKGVLANWNLQAPLEYHRVTPSSHSMMIKPDGDGWLYLLDKLPFCSKRTTLINIMAAVAISSGGHTPWPPRSSMV